MEPGPDYENNVTAWNMSSFEPGREEPLSLRAVFSIRIRSFYDKHYCLGAFPICRRSNSIDPSPYHSRQILFLLNPKKKYYIMRLYLFSVKVQYDSYLRKKL